MNTEDSMPTLPFPMPGDSIDGATVIASVEYRDTPTYIAQVLLLRPTTPYYDMGLYYMEVTAAEGIAPARQAGEYASLDVFLNIADAAATYGED